jgi:lysophospholipase L1-like esterase
MAIGLAVALVAGLGLGALIVSGAVSAPAATSPAPSASSGASIASATTNPALPTGPTPAPTAEPLPALLGAIGDSYSQAWSVTPAHHGDHPEFSWVVGTAKNDGVLSLLERFRALGAAPEVVLAAKSGEKMDDALRQADLVATAARKLAPGKTAYVTFELGTNDLCASPDPLTDPATFQAQLTSAVEVLRAALPAGSRILMLPIPDFNHFHDITQADTLARETLARTPIQWGCYPYLGSRGTNSLAAANENLAIYDAALEAICKDINTTTGPTGRLYCTYNVALLADSDFVLSDLSTYDYFHPSLGGQAKMAGNAWAADAWGWTPLGSRSMPNGIEAGFAAPGFAGLGIGVPLGLLRRRRRWATGLIRR